MNRASPKVTTANPRTKNPTRAPVRLSAPNLAKRRRPRLLPLVLLAVASFAVTFALATWSRRPVPVGEGAPGMVWVPGGEFTMGTDSDLGWADEKPAHRIRVGGFWMDQTDVTNAQLARFVEATGSVTTD